MKVALFGKMEHPNRETLLLALSNHWGHYHHFLKLCRKNPNQKTIHELRTTLRRLIATLDLVTSFVDHKSVCNLRKLLKIQLKSVRDLRDLHVQEKVLIENARDGKFQTFKDFIHRKLKREEKSVRHALKKVKLKGSTSKLFHIEEKLAASSRTPQRDESKILTRTLAKEFQNVKTCALHTIPSDPSTFHKMRIQFKKFRYQWEIINTTSGVVAKVPKEMKELQLVLGQIQDTVAMLKNILTFIRDQEKNHSDFEIQTFLTSQRDTQKTKIQLFQKNKIKLLSVIESKYLKHPKRALV